MKRMLLGCCLLLLAACGVDGPPEPVGDREPGIVVSGSVSAGVAGSF